MPSMSGSWMSISPRSGLRSIARRTPSSPVAASTVSYLSWRCMSRTSFMFFSFSSTIRIVLIALLHFAAHENKGKTISFDDFGAQQQALRDGQAEAGRGAAVDGQLEPFGLDDRQLGRACAFQDAGGVDAELAMHARDVAAVAHEAAGDCELAPLEDRRNAETQRRRRKLLAPAVEERAVGDDQRSGAARGGVPERRIDFLLAASANDDETQPARVGGLADLALDLH